MEKYDENYEADWIITAISSGAEGAAVYKLHGNIDDVKQTLVAFAASDRKNDDHCYEHGCKSVDDVIDSSDGCGWLFLLIVHMTIIILTIKQSERIIFNQ